MQLYLKNVESERRKSKRFYAYTNGGRKLWGYRQEYCGRQLRKRGFDTKASAEAHLRQAQNDIDALERGEVRSAPTTLAKAMELHRRRFELRAKRKTHAKYEANVRSKMNQIEAFVNWCGPSKLLRSVSSDDLAEYFHHLCRNVSESAAEEYIKSYVAGLFKTARELNDDLANWRIPRLEIDSDPSKRFSGRRVTADEYVTLITKLYADKSHRQARDAADACRIARNTGGRLNEVLTLRVADVNYVTREITLRATKSRKSHWIPRTVPLSTSIAQLVQQRVGQGLANNGFVFGVHSKSYITQINDTISEVAAKAELKYGRLPGGFTFHSLRHTYITEMLERTRDIPTTMRYSGHASLESFAKYLHPTEFGEKKARQTVEGIDGKLTGCEVVRNIGNGENKAAEAANA